MKCDKMISNLYSFLSRGLKPYLKGLIKRRLKTGKEHPERYPERMGVASVMRPEGRVLWLHGASVGESLSILPIVDDILKSDPNVHVLVTTGTVTSSRLMDKRLPDRAIHQFIPMDHPDWVSAFLDHWKPDAVVWLESDFWPNMLKDIKNREIPAALVNARMSEKSFTLWRRYARGFITRLLSTFDICLAQNDAEKQRLSFFGHDNVFVTSNLKYASPKLPVDAGQLKVFNDQIASRSVWQFASTHPGEEDIAGHLHKSTKSDIPNLLTVIIPRHPERGVDISNQLQNMDLKVSLRSKGHKITADTDIYVADTLGEMGLFFDAISNVVMGGSFVPHGGHNPIEPAQFGCAVIYGPHMFNFKTICYDFELAKAAHVCADISDLEGTLKRFLQPSDAFQTMRENAKRLTDDKATARAEVWHYISNWLLQNNDLENMKHTQGSAK